MNQYMVPFGEAIMRGFANYCKFTGRASRSEYWWFNLFTFMIAFALEILAAIFAGAHQYTNSMFSAMFSGFFGVVIMLFGLAVLLPSFGLLFRRLHDTGRSGWWCLIGLIPYVGSIILIIFCCQKSQPFDNNYGPEPNVF